MTRHQRFLSPAAGLGVGLPLLVMGVVVMVGAITIIATDPEFSLAMLAFVAIALAVTVPMLALGWATAAPAWRGRRSYRGGSWSSEPRPVHAGERMELCVEVEHRAPFQSSTVAARLCGQGRGGRYGRRPTQFATTPIEMVGDGRRFEGSVQVSEQALPSTFGGWARAHWVKWEIELDISPVNESGDEAATTRRGTPITWSPTIPIGVGPLRQRRGSDT